MSDSFEEMIMGYSLSRKEGWRRWVDQLPLVRPELYTVEALAALDSDARECYNEARDEWHANFGIIATPQLKMIYEHLKLIVRSNRQDPSQVRDAAVVDGLPGLGKSTIVNTFGRDYQRRAIRRYGPLTPAGDEHIPVFRVGLTSNTTLRELNRMICEFYGHPGAVRGNAAQLGSYALDCVLSCNTRIGIIDDLHFIDQQSKDGLAVSNHLKWLSNVMPVTFIYAGVGLEERRFFEEGLSGPAAALSQSGRRWTRLSVEYFDYDEHWLHLVKAIDQSLVLARWCPGQLTQQSDYLFGRTGGHIGSLRSLVRRAACRAIEWEVEAITREILDSFPIDEAAEKARRRFEVTGHVPRKRRSKLPQRDPREPARRNTTTARNRPTRNSQAPDGQSPSK